MLDNNYCPLGAAGTAQNKFCCPGCPTGPTCSPVYHHVKTQQKMSNAQVQARFSPALKMYLAYTLEVLTYREEVCARHLLLHLEPWEPEHLLTFIETSSVLQVSS